MLQREHVNQLLLAGIMGVSSIGVSYIRDLSKEVQHISAVVLESRTEANIKFKQITESLGDHETRIRQVEKKQRR